MREALGVIAEANDSDRLKKFLETGIDRESMALVVSRLLRFPGSWRRDERKQT